MVRALPRWAAYAVWLTLVSGCSLGAPASSVPRRDSGSNRGSGAAGHDDSPRADLQKARRSDASVPCTPMLDSKSEFFVPCTDAGTRPQLDAGTPVPLEAGVRLAEAGTPKDAAPPTPPDAGTQPPRDASMNAPDARVVQDSGCPSEPRTCAQASIETKPTDVVCTLQGDVVHVRTHACETCGTAGRLLQFWVMANFCGSCADGTSKGYPGNYWFEAQACRDFDMDLDLTSLTFSNNPCVDVYPRFDNAGDDLVTDVAYKIRSCRCDLDRQTCVQCVNGACDSPP
jgi:hypothetical protein